MVHLLVMVLAQAGGEADTAWLKALGQAGSYQFVIHEGKAARGLEGKFQKDAPVHFVSEGIEFYRKGEVMVYKQKDKWQKTRTGTLSDPLIILGASSKVRTARLPHEELAALTGAWSKVSKAGDATGMAIWTGELDEKAAQALARTEHRGVARGGKARVWLEKGLPVKYEIAIRLQGRIGGAEIDGSFEKAVTLSAIGAARVTPPAEAIKAFE